MNFDAYRAVPLRGMFAAAGMTFCLHSERELKADTLEEKMEKFRVDAVSGERISLYHHFGMPEISRRGETVYDRTPWTILKEDGQVHYIWTNRLTGTVEYYAVFTGDYHEGHIFHYNTDLWDRGHSPGLLMRTNDQVLFLPLLQQRGGFVLHSSAVVQGEYAVVLVGHSGAGKSTATNHFGPDAVVISEDRNILLPEGDAFYVYGSWVHYNNDRITNLKKKVDALYFIKKAEENRLEPLSPLVSMREALSHVVRGYATAESWNATIDAIEKFVQKNSCFYLHFRKDSGIMKLLDYRN